MQVITKFFSGSQEVDVEKSVKASIEASTAPFTTQELADALIAANPQDEMMEDVEFVRRQVRSDVACIFSNRLCAMASWFICDELPDGRYVRHGVEVVEPAQPAEEEKSEQEEILVCVRPERAGSQRTSVTALVRDERKDSTFLSPDEAESYASTRYPEARRVDINSLIQEYRSRVSMSGISFEVRASIMR